MCRVPARGSVEGCCNDAALSNHSRERRRDSSRNLGERVIGVSCAATTVFWPEQPSGEMAMAELKGSAKLGQYLKGLRQGYGYSLRKVEEKASVHGGDIDNSQLSRYEKGICYPSFDKLRTLGRIFNVSIQTFSDVVDLEELEQNQPAGDEPEQLLEDGRREFFLGDYGRAYAHFQKARALLEERPDDERALQSIARARASAALSLIRMGKLSLAEYELRQLLRNEARLDARTVTSALLQLSTVHRWFGDLMLAELEGAARLELGEHQVSEPAVHRAELQEGARDRAGVEL